MKERQPYAVALFDSISHALKGEKILQKDGIPCRLIPVPRHLSSDCGVSLKFALAFLKQAEDLLAEVMKVDIHKIT